MFGKNVQLCDIYAKFTWILIKIIVNAYRICLFAKRSIRYCMCYMVDLHSTLLCWLLE